VRPVAHVAEKAHEYSRLEGIGADLRAIDSGDPTAYHPAQANGGTAPMSGDDEKARLRRLEERIAAAKAAPPDAPAGRGHHDQANLAWRMVTELVAGLGIGLAMGLGLDALFGTGPVLLVVFTGLGFVAGIKVMLSTAREVQAGAERPDGNGTKEG